MNNFINMNQNLLSLLVNNNQNITNFNQNMPNYNQVGLNFLLTMQHQEMVKRMQTYQIMQSKLENQINFENLDTKKSIEKMTGQKIIREEITLSDNFQNNARNKNENEKIIKKYGENQNSENEVSVEKYLSTEPLKDDVTNQIKITLRSPSYTEREEESGEKPKFFKCPYKECDKIFPKESNLVDHLRTHTGEKPYKCSFENCEKRFSQLGNLRKHETVHVGVKAFYCEFSGCGKGFSAMYNLKIHSRSHSGEKPYKCTIEACKREFYDKGNLKYHEKTSHIYEIKNFPFSCDHIGCNLKFKTKKQKLIHHHNLEPDCKNEKHAIIKVLGLFKKFTHSMINQFNIDKEALNSDQTFIDLKTNYVELEKKLLDPDYFNLTVGENFEDIPKI